MESKGNAGGASAPPAGGVSAAMPGDAWRGHVPRVVHGFGNVLAWFIKLALMALLSVIVLTLVTQVIWRYVFNAALIWPEEVARYSFVWLSFLGVLLLLLHGWFMLFDALLDVMPPQARSWIALGIELSLIPLLLILAVQGFVMMRLVEAQVAPSLDISMIWVYLSAPISGILGLWFVFERLITGSVYEQQQSIFQAQEE